MTNLKKYHNALSRYRAGEFGEECLSLVDILKCAGAPDVLREMTAEELTELMAETSTPMLRAYFLRLRGLKV